MFGTGISGRIALYSVLAIAAIGGSTGALAQQKTSRTVVGAFPGAVNEINETHRDWELNCSVVDIRKLCVLMQTLGDKDTRAPILSMEFTPIGPDELKAVLTFPFSANLGDSVRLSVGTIRGERDLPFQGCDANGCKVIASIGGEMLRGLQASGSMRISTVSRETGKRIIYPSSLAGFSTAYSRAVTLLQ